MAKKRKSLKPCGRLVRMQKISAIKSKDRIAEVKFEKDYEQFLAAVDKDIEKEFESLK